MIRTIVSNCHLWMSIWSTLSGFDRPFINCGIVYGAIIFDFVHLQVSIGFLRLSKFKLVSVYERAGVYWSFSFRTGVRKLHCTSCHVMIPIEHFETWLIVWRGSLLRWLVLTGRMKFRIRWKVWVFERPFLTLTCFSLRTGVCNLFFISCHVTNPKDYNCRSLSASHDCLYKVYREDSNGRANPVVYSDVANFWQGVNWKVSIGLEFPLGKGASVYERASVY